MSEYKRKTEWAGTMNGKWVYQFLTATQQEAIDYLGAIEDKIEKGRLVELPCKVGQECWFILQRKDTIKLFYGQVDRFEVSDKLYIEVEALYETDKPDDYWMGVGEVEFTEKRIGTVLFFDKLEAEKRLKELSKR